MNPATFVHCRMTAFAVVAFTTAFVMSDHSLAQQAAVEAQARTGHVAKGTFTVLMKPQSESGFENKSANLGRLSLEKVFEGDLSGVGKGEMLTAMTQTKGSAGYVAIERFTGKLGSRTGSFVFQHAGAMNRGSPALSITVVPDSGSGDLIGLEGSFKIRIEGAKHFYEFEYSLPELVN